jgi:hypothetical protein
MLMDTHMIMGESFLFIDLQYMHAGQHEAYYVASTFSCCVDTI